MTWVAASRAPKSTCIRSQRDQGVTESAYATASAYSSLLPRKYV